MGKIKKIGIGLGVVVLSFVILVIIAAITYEDSTQQVSSNLEFDDSDTNTVLTDWVYEDMLRNEKFYIGKIIPMHAYVKNYIQYDEEKFGLGVCALSDDDSNYSNYNPDRPPLCDRYFWVYHTGDRILEKDYIIITGKFIKITELENAFGTKSYHPLLSATSLITP